MINPGTFIPEESLYLLALYFVNDKYKKLCGCKKVDLKKSSAKNSQAGTRQCQKYGNGFVYCYFFL